MGFISKLTKYLSAMEIIFIKKVRIIVQGCVISNTIFPHKVTQGYKQWMSNNWVTTEYSWVRHSKLNEQRVLRVQFTTLSIARKANYCWEERKDNKKTVKEGRVIFVKELDFHKSDCDCQKWIFSRKNQRWKVIY